MDDQIIAVNIIPKEPKTYSSTFLKTLGANCIGRDSTIEPCESLLEHGEQTVLIVLKRCIEEKKLHQAVLFCFIFNVVSNMVQLLIVDFNVWQYCALLYFVLQCC